MPSVDFESLIKPVSAEEPCGVDLELAGDVDYMNFLAGAEGMLPKSFFRRDQAGNEDRPFDRSSIDFDGQFNAAKPFLEQTRDLRLLGILAKLSILNRDLAGFIACVRAIVTLLETHWEEVHPRGEDGDFSLRMVAVEAIDSMPTVVMPLQFMPLIDHKRYGTLSYRNYAVAKGEAAPRGEEEPMELVNAERILNEVELADIVGRRGQLAELDTALKQIRQIWMANCSGPSVALERLPAGVAQILAMFDAVVARRDPSAAAAAAPGADGGADPGFAASFGAVASPAHAAAALAAVAHYFASREPSSPALLLVRQAHALIGKSFIDVMRTLVPDQVDRAAFNIGREQVFDLPVERLAGFADGEPAPPAEVAEPEPAPEPAEPTEPAGDETAEAATDGDAAPADAVAAEPAASAPPVAPAATAAAAGFDVQSRSQALALLDQIAAYLRAAEPSSPIPYLIDRARDLAQRDFLSVLKALLPADGLRSIDGS